MNSFQLMEMLKERWDSCQACEIGKLAFSHVFGEGAIPATYLFVGEGPGVSEDVLGQPFIGESGKLLRDTLVRCGFMNSETYFTNLVACRPCDSRQGANRAPTNPEIINCSDRLANIISFVRPKLIVAVGSVASLWLSEYHSAHQIRMIKHPAFILRNGGKRGPLYWDWVKSILAARKLAKETK